MVKAGTDKTKAVKAGGMRPPMGTAAVLGRYLARNRKASAAVPAIVVPPKPTPERAISTAIGRAARKSCALASFPVQARMGRATLAELIELLPDRALLLIVENHLGAHGIVALSPGFLSAIIEMQSMGRVFSHDPPERRPTRTDASICAEFVNAALAELAAELGVPAMPGGLAAFRFASFVEDPKPLELMLEDTIYHSFRLETRLGQGGTREGRFLAFLPGADLELAALPADGAGQGAVAPARASAARSLSEAVRGAPIALNAVLCRKTISLRDLRMLVPGATLALPFDAMARTRLETGSGLAVITGKLGALHGHRAIRIASAAGAEAAGRPEDADAAPHGGFAGDFTDDRLAENIFAGEGQGDHDPAPDFAAEPPLGDMSGPDAFRPDPAPTETEAGKAATGTGPASSALALPMNFIIE